MPTGERRPAAPRRRRAPRRGYTYLLLLFLVAASGVGAATLGVRWQTAAQRERETELLFRGLQLRDALQRYHDQTPPGQPRLPQTLEQLLADARGGTVQHRLRRLHVDPFTGDADWVLLRAGDGGIVGLHSRSTAATLRRQGLPPGVDGNGALSVDQWQFRIDADPAAAPGP